MSEPVPIGDIAFRKRVDVEGVVRSIRVVPWANASPVVECTIYDDTGGMTLVFLGRRSIGGLVLGRRVRARGRVIEVRRKLAIMNPVYELLPAAA